MNVCTENGAGGFEECIVLCVQCVCNVDMYLFCTHNVIQLLVCCTHTHVLHTPSPVSRHPIPSQHHPLSSHSPSPFIPPPSVHPHTHTHTPTHTHTHTHAPKCIRSIHVSRIRTKCRQEGRHASVYQCLSHADVPEDITPLGVVYATGVTPCCLCMLVVFEGGGRGCVGCVCWFVVGGVGVEGVGWSVWDVLDVGGVCGVCGVGVGGTQVFLWEQCFQGVCGYVGTHGPIYTPHHT